MASVYYWASACLAVIVTVFALDIMGLFNRKNYLELDGKVWRRLSKSARSVQADFLL
jgi:hypothetical protein